MRRDQHLKAPLIRQLFVEQSKPVDRRDFEGHNRESRRRIIPLILCSDVNLVIRGCLACHRHTDTLLVISDSGPEDEWSKVTLALLLMSTVALTHATTLTDTGGVAPAECRSIPW